MLTTILIGLIVILYAAGMYLMAAFIPYIEHYANEKGYEMRPGWKLGMLVGWPIMLIIEAVVAGKED